MDIGGRARRKKSHFRPWNSFIGKKQTADAATFAEQRANDVPAIRKLTVGLIETYEAINAAYYEKKRREGRPARRQASEREHALPGSASASDGGHGSRRASVASSAGSAAAAAARRASDESAVSAAFAGANISDSGGDSDSQTRLRTRVNSGSLAGPVSAAGSTTGSVGHHQKGHHTGGSGGGSAGDVGSRGPSPLSVQYCDENHDYIVRTGDMFNNRYMLEKVIGRGSFGQVVRAYDTRDNAHVAIKIIKNSALYVEQALSEVRMTAYLNRIDPDDEHAIMRLRDKFIFRGHQCLVLELLSFSLYDLLRSTEFFGVSLNLVRKFCRQILKCLAFLARADVDIAHCDLKPENVLLRHPQRSAIKVVDFGASCRVSESMFTYVQSRFYRAPEVILGLPYDTQVDVWSLGCMLVELHTGYPLFAGRDEADQISIIVERLGMPPKHMLDVGRKTGLFFDRDPDTGEWTLKDNISRKEEPIEPGSKPVQSFVDDFTGAAAGKRKRVAGGHTDHDYDVFLALAAEMLEYDPRVRISAEHALRNAFVTGASVEVPVRNGRESPPCLPAMDSALSEAVPAALEPGRKPPLQRQLQTRGSAVRFDVDDESAPSSSSNIAPLLHFGGALRLSKSEPNFDPPGAEAAQRNFVFHTSQWAEEVGIDPPAWRAGPSTRSGARLRRLGDTRDDVPLLPLRPAGGGSGGRARPRAPVRLLGIKTPVLVDPTAGARAPTTAGREPARFRLGTSRVAVHAALQDAARDRMARPGRAAPLKVGGHGSALGLRRRQADDVRLALANCGEGGFFCA